MSSLKCICGQRISANTCPNPNLNFLLSEEYLVNENKLGKKLKQLIKEKPEVLESEEEIEEFINQEIISNSKELYLCPTCTSLNLQKKQGTWEFETYEKRKS